MATESTQELIKGLKLAKKAANELIKRWDVLGKDIKDSGKDLTKAFEGLDIGDSKDIAKLSDLLKEVNNVSKQQISVNKELAVTKEANAKINIKLAAAQTKENQELAKNKVRLQEANKAAKQRAKESLGLVSAYDRESRRLNELRKRYKNLAVQERANSKEAKDLLKNITKLDKSLKAIDKTVGQSQRNVGNYGDALSELQSTTGIFGREIAILQGVMKSLNIVLAKSTVEEEVNTVATVQNSVAKKTNAKATSLMAFAQKSLTLATNLGSKALKAFKIALAGTGIGAIVIAIGGLVAMLTSTQGGLDKVERATTAVSTTFSVLLDRLSGVGEGLSKIFSGDFAEGFDQIKGSFEGIGDEISREVELIDDLTVGIQKLRIETAQFTITRSRLRKEINELRLVGEDEKKDIDLRINSLQKAFKIEEEIADERSRLARESALREIIGGEGAETRSKAEQLLNDIIAGRTQLNIKNLGVANSTTENLEETATLIAEIINAEAEQFKKQRSELAKINSLLREKDTLNNKSTKDKDKEIKKLDKLIGLIQLQSKAVSDLKKERDKATTTEEIQRLTVLITQEEKQLSTLKALTTETERNIKAETELQELKLKRAIDDTDDLDGTFDERIEATKERVKAEIDLVDFKTQEELKKENLTEKERQAIRERGFEEQRKIVEKGFDDIDSINAERSEDELEKLEGDLEKQQELYQKSAEIIEGIFTKLFEKRNEQIDKDLEATKEAQSKIQKGIDAGNEDAKKSLAEEEKREAELLAKKEKARKDQIRAEAAVALFKAYGESGGDLGKTIADTAVLTALINSLSFYHGTDETPDDVMFADKHGGVTGFVHAKEQVWSNKDRADVGYRTRDEIKDIVNRDLITDPTQAIYMAQVDNSSLEAKVDTMTESILTLHRRMPKQSSSYNTKTKEYEDVIEFGNRKETIRHKSNTWA